MKKQLRKIFPLVTLVILLSCKVTFLSGYDEVTDRVLSDMQYQTSTFFVRHLSNPGAPEFKYVNQQNFYEQLKIKVNTLQIRNNAIDKNRPIIVMLQTLDDNIRLMDSLHSIKPDGFLTSVDVTLIKAAFDRQYTALFKFIMALKARAKSPR